MHPFVIRPARPADWPAVAGWTFRHLREPFAGRRADRLVGLLADGEISPAGLLVAARAGAAAGAVVGAVVGAITVQYLTGGTAVVLLPGGETDEVRDALAAAAVGRFAAAGITQGQAFAEPAEEDRAAVLLRHGFRHTTAVVQLSLDLPAKPAGTLAPDVRFVPYSDVDPDLFADTLLATYRDSLDVPEANVSRPAAEIVAGYRGDRPDRPDPPDWWLTTDADGTPVGVLLLSAEGDGTELAYLGVVPEARGRGVGRALLTQAVRFAAAARSLSLGLTADERNIPALRLYESSGFRVLRRQLVYLWRAASC